MGIVLEGHTPDELPERLLGSVRFTRVDMNPKCVLTAASLGRCCLLPCCSATPCSKAAAARAQLRLG